MEAVEDRPLGSTMTTATSTTTTTTALCYNEMSAVSQESRRIGPFVALHQKAGFFGLASFLVWYSSNENEGNG